MKPYSIKAAYAKIRQEIIQPEILVSVSVFGDFEVTFIKMLMSTKKMVISKAILPGES